MSLTFEDFEKAKKLLQINEESTFNEIKKTYHEIIQKNHPDKNQQDNESHFKTVELMKAYEIIRQYCQNYVFDFSEESFKKQSKNTTSYEEASAEYHNWWKENYGNKELY